MMDLQAFFEQERGVGADLVIAIVVATEGSTYRKPGALMLLSSSGRRAGLLSGGCLEGDLHEHALKMLADDRRCMMHRYDNRSSEDPIWGLGLGCEGSMTIFLLRCGIGDSYEQYYQSVRRCWRFGQTRPVQVDVIATEGESRVLGNMRSKSKRADVMFAELVQQMNSALKIERPSEFNTPTAIPQWL